MEMVLKNIPGAKEPMSNKYKWYKLLEFSSSSTNNEKQMENLFEVAINKNIVLDGVIAESTNKEKIYVLRDGLKKHKT